MKEAVAPGTDADRSGSRAPPAVRRWPLCALVLALVVAACGEGPPPQTAAELFDPDVPGGCPEVRVVRGTDVLTVESPGGGPGTIALQGLVGRFLGACDYRDDRVIVDLRLPLLFQIGPNAVSGQITAPYFVAIEDAQDNLLTKQVFEARGAFPAGETQVMLLQDVRQEIFLPNARLGQFYEILVGFQLTPQQLEAALARRE